MKDNRGQTIVEFLLVITSFMILVMGIMQLAHIALTGLLVNHAAFTIARVGAVNARGDDTAMFEALPQALPFADKENMYLEILSKPDDEELEIRVVYNMQLIFPFVNKIIKEAKKLSDYRLPIEAIYMLPYEAVVN